MRERGLSGVPLWVHSQKLLGDAVGVTLWTRMAGVDMKLEFWSRRLYTCQNVQQNLVSFLRLCGVGLFPVVVGSEPKMVALTV